MTTLMQAAPTVKPTILEIKLASYSVRPIDPGFAGVAAVEVTKLVSHESYAVVLGHDGNLTCECPDFVVRHSDKGTHCKHCKAVLAAGLLVAPIRGGSPAAEVAPPAVVRPVTEKDLVRARTWGLRLPAAPIVEAPAPAVAELAPEVAGANPRDSWPAWTDADRWTTEEAPALASDEEATGIDLRAFASTITAVGDEAPSAVYTMPELAGPVVLQPELVGLPPAIPPMCWVEIAPRAYQMRNLSPDRVDYPRARRSPFVPTAEEAAEAALLLGDRRGSCLTGESSPPIGDRGVPRRATAWPRRSFDEPRETDGYPAGYTS